MSALLPLWLHAGARSHGGVLRTGTAEFEAAAAGIQQGLGAMPPDWSNIELASANEVAGFARSRNAFHPNGALKYESLAAVEERENPDLGTAEDFVAHLSNPEVTPTGSPRSGVCPHCSPHALLGSGTRGTFYRH